MISLGSHSLRNTVALAPMAGVTDVPFRQLAWRLGVGYMVGEMTGSRPELRHTRKTLLRREAVAGALHAIQIAGTDPLWIADATRDAIDCGAAIVDINFGCPAKKVCRKAAGSALMEHPDQLIELAAAAVAAASERDAIVTVKMRTGPTDANRNAPELAGRLQDVGVMALSIHGRTRACKFNGSAEYDTIATVKSRITIPLFANGDIETPTDAQRVIDHTGADGVMIGRAALGAPWLPAWIAAGIEGRSYVLPDIGQRLEWLMEQLLATHAFYGVDQGARIARKHIQWTLSHKTLASKDSIELDEHARESLARLSNTLLRAPSAAAQLDLLAHACERRAA